MRSWFRRHVRRNKFGRNDQENTTKWADSEAAVAENVLSSAAPLTLSEITLKPEREPSASTKLPVLSRIQSEPTRDDEPRKSFWRNACQMLQDDENNRKLLELYQKVLREESGMTPPQHGEEAPVHLSKIINNNLKLINEQHWTIRVGNITVELKTVLNNVAKAVQYAQSFIGTIVSGEPHTAMAWAGVSLFLPLLINASEQPKSLIEGVDYISRTLCQFAVIERLYQEQIASVPLTTVTTDTASLRTKFEQDLTLFYAHILKYQCHALYQLKSAKATRVARDMIKVQNWNGMLAELKTYEVACDKSKVVLDSESLKREFQHLHETMRGLQDTTSTQLSTSITLLHQTYETVDRVKHSQDLQIAKRQADDENLCIQNFYVSAYEKQMNRNPDAVKGTCHWLLDSPSFKHWEDSESSSLLWISAGPGCGKSVASKMLIKRLSEKNTLPDKTRTICYFFFKEDDTLQRTAENAMCAILHQILTAPGNSKLVRNAISSFNRNGDKIRESFTKMWEILMNIVQDEAAGEIICILDALDECEEREGTGRYMLIDSLRKFHRDYIETKNCRSVHLKVLVTSRPHTDIERKFKVLTGKFPVIRLSGDEESTKISEEIDLVIDEEIDCVGNELELEDTTIYALKRRLLDMDHRTYLWLRLILEVLRQQLKTTQRHLLHVIEQLPQTVDQAYEAMLNRIPGSEVKRARKLLKIVIAADRPLHVREMNVALAVDEDTHQDSLNGLDIELEENFRATLRNICGLFVTVVDSRIYLLHQTARSFLLFNSEIQPDTCDDSVFKWKGSVHLSESHLLFGKICVYYLLFRDFEHDPPFKMEQKSYNCPTQGHLLAIYASQNWGLHIRHSEVAENTPLYMAICKLCDSNYPYAKFWINRLWDFLPIFWSADENLFRPLSASVTSGVEWMVQRALKSPELLDYQCRNALCYAIVLGHTRIVQLILEERKMDTNYLVHPLWEAITCQRFELVRLLIEHGAGQDALNLDSHLENRPGAVLQHLDNCGGAHRTCETCGHYYGYPLFQLSIAHRDQHTLTHLINLGFDPDDFLIDKTTPLMWDVCCREPTMVKALIELGVNVNKSRLREYRPLCKALLLIDSDTKIKSIGGDDNVSANFLRATWEYDHITSMLLMAGAETVDLTELESMALSEFYDRQRSRKALGICTDTGLDLGKLSENSDIGSR